MTAGLPEDAVCLHASAVALAGRGLLILGRSGAGKSGLALALIALGARLIGDDRVMVWRDPSGRAMAAAHPRLAGVIEARGIGLIRLPATDPTPVALAVDLDRAPPVATPRMPDPASMAIAGVPVELIFGNRVPNLAWALKVILENARDTAL